MPHQFREGAREVVGRAGRNGVQNALTGGLGLGEDEIDLKRLRMSGALHQCEHLRARHPRAGQKEKDGREQQSGNAVQDGQPDVQRNGAAFWSCHQVAPSLLPLFPPTESPGCIRRRWCNK